MHNALQTVPSMSCSKANQLSFFACSELCVREHLCLRSVVVFMSIQKLSYVLSLYLSASVPCQNVKCRTSRHHVMLILLLAGIARWRTPWGHY